MSEPTPLTDPPTTDPGLALAPLLKRAGSVIESEIRGRSMGDTIVSGTRIRIRCGTAVDYPEGTVIAFLGGNGLVGHRVVGVGRDRLGGTYLLTRGDGSIVCDPPVEPERVLGEVIERQDGETWKPIPAAPPGTVLGRSIAAVSLLLVRTALAVDARLAARTAVLLTVVGRHLARRPPPA